MRKTFDAELLELNEEMTTMATQAQDALDVVTASLSAGDGAAAKTVVEMTASMNQMERDIEDRCLKLLLRQQPVARDLRTISTALKMVTDLQRIGDQAANIAEISLLLSSQDQVRVPENIQKMSRRAGSMVRQAIASYTERDVEQACGVVNLDDEVDLLFTQTKSELIDRIAENRDDADEAVDLIIIAKYLERIANHAVNIARWAMFCVTGVL
ncbi:MAG: phosphate signaling complex protein PhoU [Oscillospiraceae bacterium]